MKNKSYHTQVFEVVCRIPKGSVSTYGAIADYLCLGSARMVGWALHNCHAYEEWVPAHRVVNSKGELSGRNQFHTPTMMQEMLEQEGLEISDHKIIGFSKVLWRPEEADVKL